MNIRVMEIPKEEARPWIMKKHYAKRWPMCTFAYGLFEGDSCKGVVTYGSPPKQIMDHCMNETCSYQVLELTRLCVDATIKNASSMLVGRSLIMIPKPCCVVSYADGEMGHVGYIYQATNFVYTGAVTAHDCEYLIGGKWVHPRTLAGKGITAPGKWAIENNIKKRLPKPKHRYFYFTGNKREKKAMRKALKYPILPYPKGETKRYDASAEIETQGLLF